MLSRGAAIGFISSAAGLGWESNLGLLKGLLDTPDFESGVAWFAEHGKADYFHTKQAVCAYVARSAFPLLKRGIRINAICPGPTDTPLAQANAATWLGFGADFRAEVDIPASTALEQAYPLVFVCSDGARAINGITLISDAGYPSSGITESFPAATDIARSCSGGSSDQRLTTAGTTSSTTRRRNGQATSGSRPPQSGCRLSAPWRWTRPTASSTLTTRCDPLAARSSSTVVPLVSDTVDSASPAASFQA